MRKFILLLVLLSQIPANADSCFPLYDQESKRIQDKDGYTKNVGGQVFVQNGQLGYWPGIKVQANIDNWARDFVDAIKWGPYIYSFSSHDPRKDWLEAFRKSIKKDCKIPENDYDKLRAILTELMEDGSFCPEGKILRPKLLGGKSAFKKILKKAVEDQKFAHYCQDRSIVDESYREIKDIDKKRQSSDSKASGSNQ